MTFVFLVMGFFMFAATGCGGGAAPAVSSAAVVSAVSPTATQPASLPPVPVSVLADTGYPAPSSGAYPAAENDGLPAPVLLPTDVPQAPPTPTPVATLIVPTPVPSPTAETPDSATPQPTFTPPSLPQTSADEHYWLIRPIPEGGTVWTDKVYPYGSTRGGLLRTHHGVEFNVTYDTPVIAAASGTVVFAGSDAAVSIGPTPDFYGNVVVIQHEPLFKGQPFFTLYGHLNSINVAQGQFVQAEDLIGLSGATGVADGPHLHFEVRVGENSYANTRNPALWLWPFPERGTIAGRVVFPDGSLAMGAPISARRVDGPSQYLTTTSYADTDVNADEGWGENFILDDVPAGFYEVIVKDGPVKYTAEVWVYERQTSFVEIVVEK